MARQKTAPAPTASRVSACAARLLALPRYTTVIAPPIRHAPAARFARWRGILRGMIYAKAARGPQLSYVQARR